MMFIDLINLFFPSYCLTCQGFLVQGEKWLCTTCFATLPETDYHHAIDNPMAQKFYGRVPIRYAMGFCKFRRNSHVQQLIYELKYNNQPKIGQELGRYYGVLLAKVLWEHPFQGIIPVPLHAAKLRQRGYNQSAYFAQGLATSLSIPWYAQCLVRIKDTLTQTTQTKLERLQNLTDAFYVADEQVIAGKHILLVDDVITTGATLEACSLTLLAAGAQEVSLATIAIAE